MLVFTNLQGGGGDLPKNGDYWHAIRRGELPNLSHYSQQLNDLLKVCITFGFGVRILHNM